MKTATTLFVSGLLAATLVGCGSNANKTSEPAKTETKIEATSTKTNETTKTDAATSTKTYDTIYTEYSAKIKEAGTKAAEEFKAESAGKSDVTQLATLANEKVQDVATICVNGGTEMAELMIKNGDSQSVYEEAWLKLYDVYQDEALKVYDEYIDAYAAQIPGVTEEMKQQLINTYKDSIKQMAPTPKK